MRKIVRLALLGLASGAALGAVTTLAGPAHAGVFFDYAGVCATLCAEIGLAAGGDVSGFVELADSAVVPNGPLQDADILAFDFDFGDLDLASPADALIVLNGTAFLDATANGFVGTGQLQFRLGDGFVFVAAIDLSDGENWSAGPPPDFESALGSGGFTRRQAPEPAALGLLGLGLLGLVQARRERT